MNGNRYLVDTNIIIYLLSGDRKIAEILDRSQVYISFITELELLSFKKLTLSEKSIIKEILNDIIIFDINAKIKQYTIELRTNLGLKIPDAIIAATAKFLNIPILTADQEFEKIEKQQIIIYKP